MKPLARDDLMSLEVYSARRVEFRREVMAHKAARIVSIGPNMRLFFEDRLTIQYQVQEMLRTERIFEATGIQEELDAYNPLVPDGANWKATQMIEFTDENERRNMLTRLVGVENRTWVQVTDHDRVYAIADEDLERDTDEKTSAVHFLRFELDPAMIADLKKGASLSMGVDHGNYRHEAAPVPDTVRHALIRDLD
ncbi:MAG TPA: DUF3501 family protein [Gammaproteobacteria bacterium]